MIALSIPRTLEGKVLWQTLGLNYGAHSTAKIFMCLTLLLQLALLESMAVKLTTCMRCQYHDESCHSYRHVNNFTNASFTIKFSTLPCLHVFHCRKKTLYFEKLVSIESNFQLFSKIHLEISLQHILDYTFPLYFKQFGLYLENSATGGFLLPLIS